MNLLKNPLIAGLALVALSGCGMLPTQQTPKVGTLNRTLLLVDTEGTRYGVVEMNPVSGGRIFDTQGQLIGTIITPAVTSSVTTVTPVVTPQPTAPLVQPFPVR